VFRAWFVRQPPRYDEQGQPINAVRGFLDFVYRLLYEQRPQQLAFAFDTSLQSSARKSIYPDYKANRSPAPDELKQQFQLCRDFLDALGIVQASSVHHEADDLIGTWATQQQASQQQVIIVSGDKDLTQLLQAHDVWWDYGRRSPLNAGGVKSQFGAWPEQIADQLAIAGDKADNIPGVPGVGMATAAKLLKRFGRLDNLLANREQIGSMQVRGAKRLQALVTEHQDTLRLARQLTGVHCAVPDVPSDLSRQAPDPAKLEALCAQLQLPAERYTHWLNL